MSQQMSREKLLGRVEELESELAIWKTRETILFQYGGICNRIIKNAKPTVCFYSHTPEGVFTFLSPSSEGVFGFTPMEGVGKNWRDLIQAPKDTFSRVDQYDRSCVAGENPEPVDAVIYHPTKGLRVLEIQDGPVYDDDGVVVAIEGFTVDVTELRRFSRQLENLVQQRTVELESANKKLSGEVVERKLAESQLKESEERYRLLYNRSPIMMHSGDKDGKLLNVNDRWLDVLGYKRNEVIGRKIADFLTNESREFFRGQVLPNFIQTGQLKEVPYQMIKKNGEVLETLVSSTAHRDHGGNVLSSISVIEDITEKKRAEEELAKTQALLEAAIEQSPAGILVADVPEVSIRLANAAAMILCGVDSAGSAKQKQALRYHRKAYHTDGTPFKTEDLPLYQAVLQGKASRNVDLIVKGQGEEEHWLIANAAPVFDKNGEIIAGVEIFVDISDLKKVEKEARLAQERMFHAAKMVSLGTVVSGVAHEINNPILFVMLNAPALKKIWLDLEPLLDEYKEKIGDFEAGGFSYQELKQEVPVLLDHILQGATRIKNIVRDLKSYTQQAPAELNELVDINQVVQSPIMFTKNLISKSTDNFLVELGAELPRFLGSKQRVEQVLINLVVNACEALQDKSEAIALTTSCDNKDGTVVVEVRDSGPGITEDAMPQVTDPFFTTKRDTGGTGLGLSVSAGIVERHGGSMKIEPNSETGVTVTVKFPMDRTDQTARG